MKNISVFGATTFLVLAQLTIYSGKLPAQHTPGPEPDFARGRFGVRDLGTPVPTVNWYVFSIDFFPGGERLFVQGEEILGIDWKQGYSSLLWNGDAVANEQRQTMVRASLSPDGTMFVRLDNGPGVHFHDPLTRRLIHSFQRSERNDALPAWAREKDLLALADRGQVLLHNPRTGALVRTIPHVEKTIGGVALSPDGNFLAVASRAGFGRDCSVFLYSLEKRGDPVQLPGTIENDEGGMSFSSDSSKLAILCSIKGRGRVLFQWDLKENRMSGEFNASGELVAYAPEGGLIATAGGDELRLWESTSGRLVAKHADNSRIYFRRLAFSPDGKILAAGMEDRVLFWTADTLQPVRRDPVMPVPAEDLVFSGDGRHLVASAMNGEIVAWNWKTKQHVWTIPPTQYRKRARLSADPHKPRIGVVRNGEDYLILDQETGKILHSPALPSGSHLPMLFRPDGEAILVASAPNLVEWNLASDRAARIIEIPSISKHGKTTGRTISSLRVDLWDPELIWYLPSRYNNEKEAAFHLGSLSEPEFFPVNEHFKYGSQPSRPPGFVNTGRTVWNMPYAKPAFPSTNNSMPTVAYPYGNLIMMADDHGKVDVYDALSQGLINQFDFGPGRVRALAVSPDGKDLVAATSRGIGYCILRPLRVPQDATQEKLWKIMSSEEHWQAYLASWALAGTPDWIAFVEAHLKPEAAPTESEKALLLAMLADGNQEVRQTAARQMLDLGITLSPENFEMLVGSVLTTRLFHEMPLEWLSESGRTPLLLPLSDHRRKMRAVMILQEDASPAALKALERLGDGWAEAPLTKASKRALAACKRR